MIVPYQAGHAHSIVQDLTGYLLPFPLLNRRLPPPSSSRWVEEVHQMGINT